MIRSLLYVPADNQTFIAKAHQRDADAIILDLEDAVAEASKDAARDSLAEAVPSAGQTHASIFVRINSGPRQIEDAVAATRAGAFGIVVPKTSDPGAIDSLSGSLRQVEAELGRPAMRFVALIEDPGAVLDARAIARHQRVIALAAGSEDLATALGAEPTPDVLRFPKLLVHYAAKAERKLSFGMLRSIADYKDVAGLAAAAREARQHGFDGATCIHPSAVPVLNEAFSATEADIAWAERVVAAANNDAVGVFTLDGQMIDAPVIARALLVLGRVKKPQD